MEYKPTILYVEDEHEVNINTQVPLRYMSSELYVAKDGKEGLALYIEHQPDIVITDIKMPIMNGIQMAKEIKKINPIQNIIFTTAHNESGYFIEAIELQATAYILKPIDYDLLEKKIYEITEQIHIRKKLKEHEILIYEISKLHNHLLLVIDKDEDVLLANEKFLRFFGISSLDELLAKNNFLKTLLSESKKYFSPTYEKETTSITQLEDLPEDKRIILLHDKNLNTKSFLVSIENVQLTKHKILIFTEVTAISLENQILQKKAYTDQLTQIHNRTYFKEVSEKIISKAKEDDTPLCCLIFDINRFKTFNDTYGHQVGDEVLISIANILTNNMREEDLLARLGGDEFIILMKGTTLKQAKMRVLSLQRAIKKHKVKQIFSVTCSVGVAELLETDSKVDLIQKADNNLYQEKNITLKKVQ